MRAEHVARGDLGEGCGHHGGEEVIAQAGGVGRAPLLGHPGQEAGAAPLATMGVEAGVGAVHGHVAALDLARGVRLVVGTDHAPPAGGVTVGGQVAGLGEPGQHVIGAIVVKRDRAHGGGVGLGGRDTQAGADLLNGELAFGVELGQDSGEAVAAFLQVDGSGDAPVTHRVDCALVGVAGGGKGALGSVGDAHRHLLTQHPRPLEIAG